MDLEYVLYIGGTPEDVWKALVAPEATKQLYYGSIIDSTFEVGSPLKYVGPDADGNEAVHVHGEVLEYEPNRTLSFTHKVGPAYVEDDAGDYESRISYRLEPAGRCTKLTLVHDQWTENDPAYDGSAEVWPMILSNTKTLVETGTTLDME